MENCVLLLTLLLNTAAAKDCTEVEHKNMQHKYTECTTNYHYKVQETLHTAHNRDIQRHICDYFSLAVNDCGKVLEMCHELDSIRKTNDNLIADLIPVGGRYSHECQVVVQYRKSRRQQTANAHIQNNREGNTDFTNAFYYDQDVNKQEHQTNTRSSNENDAPNVPNIVDCSESKMQLADDYMENCTSFIATSAYSKLEDIIDPIIASSILCSALDDIDTDCVRLASTCLTPEYVSWFVDPMKKYLLELASSKVGEQSLQECHPQDSNDLSKAQKDKDIDDDGYYNQDSYGQRNTHEPHDVGRNEYNAPDATDNMNAQEDKYIGGHRVMSQTSSDNKHKYQYSTSNNGGVMCSKTNLYQQMDNCSHFTAVNVHKDIQNIYDSSILYTTACNALNIIGTECVKELNSCFSTTDVSEIRHTRLEEWKNFLIELIERASGNKLSLDNCHALNMKYDDSNIERKDNNLINYHEKHEDIREDEYNGQYSAFYGNSQDYKDVSNDVYDVQSGNDLTNVQHDNELCSESNKQIAEDHMDNCTRSIATTAYSKIHNTADPVIISHTLCSTQALIHTDCVKPLKKCFSSEYINWLVDPMKNYLHELAISKVNEQSLQKCDDYNTPDSTYFKNVQESQDYMAPKSTDSSNVQDSKDISRHISNDQDIRTYYEPAQNHQSRTNDEHSYQYSTGSDTVCFEATVYQGMGNCSHFAALKVHTDIQHSTDPNILNNIACKALHIIGTDCVKDLKNCFTTMDANQIKVTQVEEWKHFLIELIEGRSGIKLSLENCHSVRVEYDDRNVERKDHIFNNYHEKEYANNHNQDKQSFNKEIDGRHINEDHQNTKSHEDTREYEYTRQDITTQTSPQNHKDVGYHVNDNEGNTGVRNVHSNNDFCSEYNMQIAESHMDNCTRSIANNAYSKIHSITDPTMISNTLCSTQAMIDTDCVEPLKQCFSPEYISWLVEPMKKYLHDLAVEKVGAQSLKECHEVEPGYESNSQKSVDHTRDRQNIDGYHYNTHDYNTLRRGDYRNSNEQQQTGGYEYSGSDYTDRDIDHYRDGTCSETILYEQMDKCSRRIAINVYTETKDNPNSYKVSNIICNALNEIGTTCVNVLEKCFSTREVNEMRSIQIKQWVKYFIRITAGVRAGKISLENCQWMLDQYVDINVEAKDTMIIDYNNKQDTESVDTYETTQNTVYHTRYSNQYVTTQSRIYYTENNNERQIGKYDRTNYDIHQETCSETNLQETLKEMSNCSYSTAINVHWNLQSIVDPILISNILCNALSIIAKDCVNILYKCYTTDNVKEMKINQLSQMKQYLLKIVNGNVEHISLENCQEIRETYAYNTQDNTKPNYQNRIDTEYYNTEDNTDHWYYDNTDHGYQDMGGHGYNVQETTSQRNSQERQDEYSFDYNALDNTLASHNEACSKSTMQLAEDHMDNCTRIAATHAYSQLKFTSEPKEAFNVLCSALTIVGTDCIKLLRKCYSPEYVKWMTEPMKKYLIQLGRGRVDSQSLQDCQYSNGFTPYKLD